ncbi:MAG TPA: DedA family protein [Microbacterium sp.]|uniref:DedA family protein n=1 Tax=Microbacterium sp. TaxID=51671 RepID=UPI002C49559A|nr:DedA family protein [Microbacterium sp.]HWI30395.1 DedA family protein [Microbacterium sp.]
MNEFLTWLLDVVQSVDPVVRTLLAGVAIMLETSVLIGLVVPGDTVVIVAATAVSSVPEGILLGVAVVVGALIGESIGFWLGRWLGPKIRDSWVGRRIGHDHWERSERYLRRRGGPAIFLSRFLPVLHSLVPLTVGMSGFGYRRFLAWTVPACVLWATAYISVAALAAGTYRELSNTAHFAGYLFVGIIVLFLAAAFVGKKLIERLERRHMHDEEAAGGEVAADAAAEISPDGGVED